MRSTVHERGDAFVWDVARPARLVTLRKPVGSAAQVRLRLMRPPQVQGLVRRP
jgi:hypothetical protein